MAAPTILALDNALTTVGWCVHGRPDTWSPPSPANRSEEALAGRLLTYEQWLTGLLGAHRPQLAVVEGYSYASANRAHQVGELGWACRRTLWAFDVPWTVITPGQRAKYATGKGSAGKTQVVAEAIRRLGFEGHDDNAADALWLHTMALDHYTDGWGMTTRKLANGRTLNVGEVVPKAHREALDKIDWPQITRS